MPYFEGILRLVGEHPPHSSSNALRVATLMLACNKANGASFPWLQVSRANTKFGLLQRTILLMSEPTLSGGFDSFFGKFL